MKLLTINEYKKIEYLLRNYDEKIEFEDYTKAIEELKQFFNKNDYDKLLTLFYLDRNKYKYRLPTNETIFIYLSEQLHIPKPTLYLMRKEIVYKSAMVFYKYNLIGNDKDDLIGGIIWN